MAPERTSTAKANVPLVNGPETRGRSAPNILQRSMLMQAVKRDASPDYTDRKRTFTKSGHRCWSSIKIREWQEFQRLLNESSGGDQGYSSTTSYLYFTSPSRASRKSILRQMATPDSDYYKKERNKDFQRIEDALDVIKFVKNQKRKDYLSGVPGVLNSPRSNILKKEVEQTNLEQDDMMEKRLMTSESKAETEKTTDGNRSLVSRANIPKFYSFPKNGDFIPESGTRLASVGVNWRYSNCHSCERRQAFSAGSVSRTLHPVTEAMRRNGTAPSVIKCSPLGQGQWPVEKVWKRKVNDITLPLQMARTDIRNLRNKFYKSDNKRQEEIQTAVQNDGVSEDNYSVGGRSQEPDDL